MDIEEKLKEVGEYFKSKILDGDYKLLKVDAVTAEVIINDKYPFKLWIAGIPAADLKIYTPLGEPEALNDTIKFSSIKERCLVWKSLKQMVTTYNNEIALKVKMAQIKALQKGIDEITTAK